MKRLIIVIMISLVSIFGVHRAYAQEWREHHVRGHVDIHTGGINIHAGYGHPGYYHRYYRGGYYRNVRPVNVYYNTGQRYWVPGYWDSFGNWVPGHWAWY